MCGVSLLLAACSREQPQDTPTGAATSVTASGTTTFSGMITAGTNPASLSYTVTCDLSAVGGSSVIRPARAASSADAGRSQAPDSDSPGSA